MSKPVPDGRLPGEASRALTAPLEDRTLLEASAGTPARSSHDSAPPTSSTSLTTLFYAERGYGAHTEECRAMVRGTLKAYHYPNQYENPANPGINAGTTGRGVWEQTDSTVTKGRLSV